MDGKIIQKTEKWHAFKEKLIQKTCAAYSYM